MINDKNLMACPFCGVFVHQDTSASYFRKVMLYCEGCDMYFCLDALDATEDDLEKAFNTRHQLNPVKPYVDIDEWRCGNCGHKITQQKMYGENVLFEEYFDYCPACGSKVAWNETEQEDGKNAEEKAGS